MEWIFLGSTLTSYAVTKDEVQLFCGDASVREWLGKFRESTRETNAYALCRYFKWLRVEQGLAFTPKELLNDQIRLRASNDIECRRKHLKWLLEHTRDNPDFQDHTDQRKYDIFIIVKNFYDYHEVPLTSAKNVFGPRRKHENNRRPLTMAKAKKIISVLPQREKTILLIVLQSGMEIGAVLNKMNWMWDKVMNQILDGKARVKVDFLERKGNGFPYFTYFSYDAIQELKKWLLIRDRIVAEKGELESKPIFITHAGTIYTENSYFYMIRYYREKRDLPNFVTHQFRKLFKTEAGIPERGIDPRIVKFWMGHITDIDDVGGIYDKQPQIYEEIIEREYAKLEPYINIYSVVQPQSNEEANELRREVAELRSIVKVLDDPKLLEKLKIVMESLNQKE